MKINQILIFITTAVVLYSISSSGPVDAWLFHWDYPILSARTIKQCDNNENCEKSEKCSNYECKNACLDQECNEKHEGCLVIDHVARCVKKEKSCTNKNQCHSSELCRRLYCINACEEKNCPDTEVCQVKNHEAECRKEKEIWAASCSADNNCGSDKICKNRKCMDACDDTKCGEYQKCEASGHKASCHCVPGFYMNSSSKKCEQHKCTADNQCKGRQICKKGSGDRYCVCMDGHNRNSTGYCVKSCTKDGSECDGLEVCNLADLTCSCIGTINFQWTWPFITFIPYKWNDNVKKCEK